MKEKKIKTKKARITKPKKPVPTPTTPPQEKNMPAWALIIIALVGGALFWWAAMGVFFVAEMFFHSSSSWNDDFEYNIVVEGNVINIGDGTFTIDKDTLHGEYNEALGTYTITGVIKSEADEDETVILTFAMFDEDNNIIGNLTANIEFIKPGETWRFRAVPRETGSDRFENIDTERIDRFELRDASAFGFGMW